MCLVIFINFLLDLFIFSYLNVTYYTKLSRSGNESPQRHTIHSLSVSARAATVEVGLVVRHTTRAIENPGLLDVVVVVNTAISEGVGTYHKCAAFALMCRPLWRSRCKNWGLSPLKHLFILHLLGLFP